LLDEVEERINAQPVGVARVKAAVETTLGIFSRHRLLAKILLVDVAGLGRLGDQRLLHIHARIAASIARQLEALQVAGTIAPLDTDLTATVWLGAINEIVVRWIYTGQPDPLEDAIPALTRLLLQSIGLRELSTD
jgi:hypothetical protein